MRRPDESQKPDIDWIPAFAGMANYWLRQQFLIAKR